MTGNQLPVLTQGRGGIGGRLTLHLANGPNDCIVENGYLLAGGDVIQSTSWNSLITPYP